MLNLIAGMAMHGPHRRPSEPSRQAPATQHEAQEEDRVSWPGPVGWWYVPLFWLVVLLAAALAWSSH